MTFTLQHGLPADLQPAAAQLYWQAFGGKLGKVMGPEPRALQYFERVIQPQFAYAALGDTGQLLGMAGYKTPAGSFAGGSGADLRVVYGLAGAAWRIPLLWFLGREIDNDRFLLDGICVARDARGQGIGSALMTAICAEAKSRGYGAVRLDVINTNWRAKALYERLGFVVEKITSIGVLRHAFGFQSATTMVKKI